MSCTGIIRKGIIIILILGMCLTALSSCADSSNKNKVMPGTVISETDDSITIVDQADREVTVKRNPQSIALCYRVVIRFLLSLDMGDKIKGIGKSEEFLNYIQPSLRECADVGKGVADIEALAELKPELFIHKSSDVETLDAVEKIGIPSVGIDVETPESMTVALKILGIVCGREDKADKLISYYEDEISNINDLTSGIRKEDRKKAIVMGSSIGRVADGSMLQGRMLTLAGAENCADELKTAELWPTVGVEQIFDWNPDYIFITNSQAANYSVEDILNASSWSEINAVKNKNVYMMPAQMDSWEFPGVVSILGIDYMMHTMYPNTMSDNELQTKVEMLYELMYNREIERSFIGY